MSALDNTPWQGVNRSGLRAREMRLDAAAGESVARMWVERYPVTILLGVQYALMVIWPAILKNTQPLGVMLGIVTVAVLAAAYVETLRLPLRPTPPVKSAAVVLGVSPTAAKAILAIGWIATIGAALGGNGSYATQLGYATTSPLVSILTPFTTWALFGVAMYLWLSYESLVSRRRAGMVVGLTCLMELLVGLQQAILGAAAAFIMTALVLAVFARLIRLRSVVVALLLIPLLWPPLYELRDVSRRNITGADSVVSAGDPIERLQLDEQIARVGVLRKQEQLSPPSAVTLIRTGLLPSIIDRDRPPLDTGSRISVALGGSPRNSQSATMLGNVYIFGSLWLVATVAGSLAIVMGMAVRRRSAWSMSVAGLVFLGGISFNSTFPDSIPRILQGTESLLVAYLFAGLLAWRSSRRATRRGSGAPTSEGSSPKSARRHWPDFRR